MNEQAEIKSRCRSHNPYNAAMRCMGKEGHEEPHYYYGINWTNSERPKLHLLFTEAEIFLITWALTHISSESYSEMLSYGRSYGVKDSDTINLYQRLISEWDRWSNVKGKK